MMIPKLKRLQNGIVFLICLPSVGVAEMVYDFDWDAIGADVGMKLTRESFESMQKQMFLGVHSCDIYVNNKYIGEASVDIREDPSSSKLMASVPAKVIQGMRLGKGVSKALYLLAPDDKVEDITQYIPEARVDFDSEFQKVNISIPQLYYSDANDVIVNSELWDYGVPALRVNYDADYSLSRYAGENVERGFLSYDAQLNVRAWRFFLRGNVNKSSDSSTTADIWDRYASTVIPFVGGKLKVGEFTTTSKYMPGIPIIGINLYEDYDQVEDRDRNYLPVISGFAVTQSTVTIRQGGRVLKEQDVPPGPFEFSDIMGIDSSGNIELEIKEKNGKTSKYLIPYTTNNKLLKEDRFSWSGSIGRYDDGYHTEHPWVAEVSAGYGLPKGVTVYGGLLVSEDFTHTLLGSAFDAGTFGSLSLQLEKSHLDKGHERDGNIVEFGWYKYFEKTQSTFDLSYRRTFEGNIFSVAESLNDYDDDWYGHELMENDYIRDQLTLSLSQIVADWGSLSGSFYYTRTKFGDKMKSLSTSFSFPIGRCHGHFQAQSSRYDYMGYKADKNWQVSFMLTIPLSTIFPDRSIPFSNFRIGRIQQDSGEWSNQVDFSSSFGRYSDWNVYLSARDSKHYESYNVGLGYTGAKATLSLNAGRSEDLTTFSGHIAGGVVGTELGFNLTNSPYGGSVALVHVPGVKDARLYSSGLDTRGEWQISNALEDYRWNTIKLDPESIPSNVYLASGFERDLVPADGAIMPVVFETFIGHQSIFTVYDRNGKQLPYGALVSVEGIPIDMEPSIVDELGQVYFSAIPQKGTLQLKWNDDIGSQKCSIPYSLKNSKKINGIALQTIRCTD